MSAKTYKGFRGTRRHDRIVSVEEDGKSRPLPHVMHHSPDGFEWGYGGSGPSDLALSILTDLLGERPEPGVYHDFKFEFVATWGDTWSIDEAAIREWLRGKVSTHDWLRGRVL